MESRLDREVLKTFEDSVGFSQSFSRIGGGDGQNFHTCSLARTDTGHRVLDDQTVLSGEGMGAVFPSIQQFQRVAIDRRIRFTDRAVVSR